MEIFSNILKYVHQLNCTIKLCSHIKCRKKGQQAENNETQLENKSFKETTFDKMKMFTLLTFSTETTHSGFWTADNEPFPYHFINM